MDVTFFACLQGPKQEPKWVPGSEKYKRPQQSPSHPPPLPGALRFLFLCPSCCDSPPLCSPLPVCPMPHFTG